MLSDPLRHERGCAPSWHPVDLGAELLSQLVERVGIDGGAVDDVILGCTTQVGAQACNIARRAVLAAVGRSTCRGPRSTVTPHRRRRRCTGRPRRSCRAPRTSLLPEALKL